MKIIKNPLQSDWQTLIKRPEKEKISLKQTVYQVFENVKNNGDKALFEYTTQFDKVELQTLQVASEEFKFAEKQLSKELKDAIDLAYKNIYAFHLAQKEEKQVVETTPGVKCWRESRGIDKVGLYIPGGTAPLFSTVLMLGIPAQIAQCKTLVLCSPPNKEGKLHPAILYAASKCGIFMVYKVGGIQAIASLTFGTESIPKVYKIFGPGNQYVTAAKQVAIEFDVAIDMPAGPSEVLVVADQNANAEYVAADLLSQAEHGTDSQVVLLSDSEIKIQEILKELAFQLARLPRKEIAKIAIENSLAVLLNDLDECIDLSNYYAPEHLILALDNPTQYIDNVINAGSVFLGKYSCESAGDYASGTNHTLPTNGYAKNYSGISLDSFIKKITFQELTFEGLSNIGNAIEIMAETEGLYAHKNAVSVRLKD